MRWPAAWLTILVLCVFALGCQSEAEASSGEFLALSYNIAGLPQEISPVNPEAHIPLISPLLNGYDIVLTQEDFDWWLPGLDDFDFANYHARLRSQVDHPYQSDQHPGPEAVGINIEADRPHMQVGDGLGLLSRFPFDEVRRIPWVACYGVAEGASDCLAMKGFGMARVELKQGIVIDIYNLHAEAGSGPEDQAARAEGFEQLAAYIQEHSTSNAIILGGDMNLRTDAESADLRHIEDSRVWTEFLASSGLTDVCDTLDCEDPTRIDKFAFRSNDRIELEPLSWRFEVDIFQDVTGTPLSDHDPLAVEWRWSARS